MEAEVDQYIGCVRVDRTERRLSEVRKHAGAVLRRTQGLHDPLVTQPGRGLLSQ